MNALFTPLAAEVGRYAEYINPEGYKIDADTSHMLGFGLEIAALGIVIVFSVLVIIWLLVELMGFVFYKLPKKRAEQSASETVVKPSLEDFIQPQQAETLDVDDSEEIAVLTAAISVYLDRPASGFIVRSVRRASVRFGQ